MQTILLCCLLVWGISFYSQFVSSPSSADQVFFYRHFVIWVFMIILHMILQYFTMELKENKVYTAISARMRSYFDLASRNKMFRHTLKIVMQNPYGDKKLAKWCLWLTFNEWLAATVNLMMVYFLIDQNVVLKISEDYFSTVESDDSALILLYLRSSRTFFNVFIIVYALAGPGYFGLLLCPMLCHQYFRKTYFSLFGPPCLPEDVDWVRSLPLTSWKLLWFAGDLYPEHEYKTILHGIAQDV